MSIHKIGAKLVNGEGTLADFASGRKARNRLDTELRHAGYSWEPSEGGMVWVYESPDPSGEYTDHAKYQMVAGGE